MVVGLETVVVGGLGGDLQEHLFHSFIHPVPIALSASHPAVAAVLYQLWFFQNFLITCFKSP